MSTENKDVPGTVDRIVKRGRGLGSRYKRLFTLRYRTATGTVRVHGTPRSPRSDISVVKMGNLFGIIVHPCALLAMARPWSTVHTLPVRRVRGEAARVSARATRRWHALAFALLLFEACTLRPFEERIRPHHRLLHIEG